jgi:LIVCS family branched-chain amino acid:cation transporter
MLAFYGLKTNPISSLAGCLPMGSQGLGWILPTVLVMVAVHFLLRGGSARKESEGA